MGEGKRTFFGICWWKNITFTHDVDDIRDGKTINGVKHEYVTLDGLIYQEKWGNNILTFSYDNNDKPYAVKYNNITYYYVLNQQGDVIRIVDENGTTKAEYTYDAWGNVIASTGTDSGIGAVNPLLYRGYYYDLEYYILMIADFLNIYTERQLRIKQ